MMEPSRLDGTVMSGIGYFVEKNPLKERLEANVVVGLGVGSFYQSLWKRRAGARPVS